MSDVLKYWRDPNDSDNKPVNYATKTERSEYLVSLAKQYIDRSWSILEIGCNCGRNVSALRDAGYTNVSGIDISQKAVYYGLYLDPTAPLVVQPLSEYVQYGKHYDCIFTMAVLEHIENTENIKQIAEMASHCIMCIEDEQSESWKHFPRNYQDIFTPLGWNQIYMENIKGHDIDGFTARVFVHNE